MRAGAATFCGDATAAHHTDHTPFALAQKLSHLPIAMRPQPTSTTTTQTELRRVARERFGVSALHSWQEEAISSLLGPAQRALVIAPTGGGKSLCYQLPACVLPGTALVVSPLISLMEDQVAGLARRGIRATYLASTLPSEERKSRFAGIRRGHYQLVYVAPERLIESIFDIVPPERLSLLAIDEAHCIVQWGHDFRPDYLRLGDVIRRSPPARLLACTATATPGTRAEILRALGVDEESMPVVMRGFARPNLALSVRHLTGPREATKRAHDALRVALVEPSRPQGAGIVYSSTRKQTELVAGALCEQGWRARAYHAGLDGDVRMRISRDFASQSLDIVVATNAFGMGIDRADVRVVVHTQPPASIEAYYQEVGRAGRDGAPARGVLFLSPADIPLRRRLIELGPDGGAADPQAVARAWALFRDLLKYVDACSCRHDFILRYFGDEEESLGGCGRCDVCRDREAAMVSDPDAQARDTETVRKTLAAVARAAKRGGMVAIAEMLRGHRSERIVRFGFDQLSTFGLLSTLSQDDIMGVLRAAIAAGYVDVTTGDYPMPYLTEPGARVMKAVLPCNIRLRRAATGPQPGDSPTSRKRASRAGSAGPGASSPARKEPSTTDARRRFEALRQLRARLAKESAVPPYVIAHDAALLAAAEQNPASPDSLAAVYGWGPSRVAKYGQAVLDALRCA
jgi:ATP-dependent DNA helicase RecQ